MEYFNKVQKTIMDIWPEPQIIPFDDNDPLSEQQLEILTFKSSKNLPAIISWPRVRLYVNYFKRQDNVNRKSVQHLLEIIQKLLQRKVYRDIKIVLSDCYQILQRIYNFGEYSERFLMIQVNVRKYATMNDQFLIKSLEKAQDISPSQFFKVFSSILDLPIFQGANGIQIEQLKYTFLTMMGQLLKNGKQLCPGFVKIIKQFTRMKQNNCLLKISNILVTAQFTEHLFLICQKFQKYQILYFWFKYVLDRQSDSIIAIQKCVYLIENKQYYLQKINLLELIKTYKQFARGIATIYFENPIQIVQTAFRINSPEAKRVQDNLCSSLIGMHIFNQIASQKNWESYMLFVRVIDSIEYLTRLDEYQISEDLVKNSSMLLKKFLQEEDYMKIKAITSCLE